MLSSHLIPLPSDGSSTYWKSFADDLDSSITYLLATPNSYNAFVELLKDFSRKTIFPQVCLANHIQGLSNNAKELYKEYTQLFEDDPFDTDSLECGDTLFNSVIEGRQNWRQELIESKDMIHSIRKAWKTIWLLGNDYTKSQPRFQVTANQVVYQLLHNS